MKNLTAVDVSMRRFYFSPVSEVALCLIYDDFFVSAPVTLLNGGIQMVEPTLSTLLTNAARKLHKVGSKTVRLIQEIYRCPHEPVRQWSTT